MRPLSTILTATLSLALIQAYALGQSGDRRPRNQGDREARQERGPGGPRNPIVLAIDTDGDGELSAREIVAAATSLKRLDANGDGKLSREELRPPGGGPEQRDRGDRPQQPEGRNRPAPDGRGDARRTSGRGPGGGGPRPQQSQWPTAEHLQAPLP